MHGNLPAFESVLEDVQRAGVDETWCLGDLIGYGPFPNECVALARERCDLCLIGNHDLVVVGQLDIDEFSSLAALAATWTEKELGEEEARYLSELKPLDLGQDIGLYHASPLDPVWEYVLSTPLAGRCIDAMQNRVSAIGHSHVALYFRRTNGGTTIGEHAPEGTELDLADGRWLINPGAVGQPRDGDPRAAWLLLDLEQWTASWRRVEYPIERTAEAIRSAGLPTPLADRLFEGQ